MTAALSELAARVPATASPSWSRTAPRIRTACAALLGWPPDQALTLHGMDNCGWAVLRRRAPDGPVAAASPTTAPSPPDLASARRPVG